MRVKFLVFLLFILGSNTFVTAQDAQYSQFYAAPLYLNPAFTGSTQQARAGINYRNQWPAVEASFLTQSAFFDIHFMDYNSSVGMIVNRDVEGLAGLNSTSAAALFSYSLYLNEWLAFTPGIQAGYYYRSLNFSALTFGDQFDPNTGQFISPSSAEQFNSGFSKGFFDVSTGGLFYTRTMWLGAAWHHLTRPSQSFIDPSDILPWKISVHGGVKIPLNQSQPNYDYPRERSITPSFQYKHQGPFDQIDLGIYLTTEPLVFGLWYRGIPFKTVNGIINNESIFFQMGLIKKGMRNSAPDELNIGYSYDITISGLGAGSGGAHEISLSYSWSMRDPRKPPKEKMFNPCPRF